jgi:YbbR domain-containing protein
VNTVDVRVRASPGFIETLDPGKVLAAINLAGAEEGERIVQLTPDQIHVPFGFRVVKITPSLLTLNLERTLRKTVPVRPRVIGRPAAGYEVAEVTSEPPDVRVAGPKSRVQEIESAFTEPVSVQGADRTVEGLIAVGLEDPLLRLEDGSRVRVVAQVREVHERRAFEGLKVVARDRPAQLLPSLVRVVVEGPASELRRLTAGDLRPFVTVPREGAVPGRLPVTVEIASGHTGVGIVETEPLDVAVRPLRARREP